MAWKDETFAAGGGLYPSMEDGRETGHRPAPDTPAHAGSRIGEGGALYAMAHAR